MEVKGISKMSVRALAFAVLEASGYKRKRIADTGQIYRYVYLESPSGETLFKFGNVSSIRLVKHKGNKLDKDYFPIFASLKKDCVKQDHLDRVLAAFKAS